MPDLIDYFVNFRKSLVVVKYVSLLLFNAMIRSCYHATFQWQKYFTEFRPDESKKDKYHLLNIVFQFFVV